MLFLPFVIPCRSQSLCEEGAVTAGWEGTFLHSTGGGQTSCERGRGLSLLPVPPTRVALLREGSRDLGAEDTLGQKSLAWCCSIQNFPESLWPRLPREVLQQHPRALRGHWLQGARGDTGGTHDMGTL